MAATVEKTEESIRLFPSPRLSTVIKTPLSILDATCARFSDTSAVWLFETPANGNVDDEFVEKIQASFVQTLNKFPQWAGQLHWAPFRANGHHTERFNRSMLTYGSEADPGVQWTVVRHDYTIASFAPTGTGSFNSGLWEAGDAFPQKDLVSPERLALYNLKDFQDRPVMSVRVNVFSCGGYGIGVKLAHQVADAQSMMVFMHNWAANARILFTGMPSSSLFNEPVFDPQQLDARAAGDIDGEAVDTDIAAAARAMPLHRYSWWDVDAPGYSPWLVASSQNCIPPAEVLAKTHVSPSTVAPWYTWDSTRPVSWGLVHFTGEELLGLQRRARESGASQQGGGAATISRTDALMAHLFQSITRARRLAAHRAAEQEEEEEEEEEEEDDDDDMVYLNVSIDCRRRVAQPLPETFLGSPLLMTHVGASASALCTSATAADNDDGLGHLALKLRETLTAFTPDKMGAILHDAAYEVSPQRLWLGFMGTRHLIATSWQRLRAYEVDFEGTGARPVYVHPIMEKCDGILVIADSLAQDGGVDVSVYLDSDAWGHFRKDLGKN